MTRGWLPLVRVRQLAIAGGIVIPLLETIRRSGDLAAWWLWIDDYLIGAALLAGAWVSRTGSASGRRLLSGAWGIAAGMGYYSFAGHVLKARETDVSGVSGMVTASVIGVFWLIALYALASSILADDR